MENKENDLIGKKITAVPKEPVNVGMDTEGHFAENIVNAAINDTLNLSELENFLSVAQNRENVYRLIDMMSQDGTVASIIESYAEDATETNPDGNVMWVESENADVVKYVTFLLSTLQINENAYGWVNSLIKYGDLYLKLFKESEYEESSIFDNDAINKKSRLHEDVILHVEDKSEHYVNFVEKVSNPAEMFELTSKGKTQGYISAPYNVFNTLNVNDYNQTEYNFIQNYKVTKGDINVFSATDYVHGYLFDDTGRTKETVDLFDTDDDYKTETNSHSYDVKRGKSLLYDWFKSWREMTLLENAIILTRLTKSSLIRVIQVEVGDMPKEMIANHLQGIKSMMEQKTSIDTGVTIGNYTNPGPVENNIYVPTHGTIGNLSVSNVGGEYDPKQLTDLEYFRDRFFSATGIPKSYVGFTDDQTGFNGGTSLTLISAKYAKRIKRIQQAFISMTRDLINILLIDRGLLSYVNNFTLRMQTPVTKEEIDRREAQTNALGMLRDTMDVLGDIERKSTRLKIIKTLMQDITNSPEVIQYIQDEIDYVEEQEKQQPQQGNPQGENGGPSGRGPSGGNSPISDIGQELGLGGEETQGQEPTEEEGQTEIEQSQGGEDYLPSFAELGVDYNNQEV